MNASDANALRARLIADQALDDSALVAGLLAGDRGAPITAAIMAIYADAADVDLDDGSQGNILAAEAVRYAAAANAARHLAEYQRTGPAGTPAMLALEALARQSGATVTPLAEGPGLSDLVPTASELWNPVKWVWLTVAGLACIALVLIFVKNKATAVSAPSPSPASAPAKKRPGRPKKQAA